MSFQLATDSQLIASQYWRKTHWRHSATRSHWAFTHCCLYCRRIVKTTKFAVTILQCDFHSLLAFFTFVILNFSQLLATQRWIDCSADKQTHTFTPRDKLAKINNSQSSQPAIEKIMCTLAALGKRDALRGWVCGGVLQAKCKQISAYQHACTYTYINWGTVTGWRSGMVASPLGWAAEHTPSCGQSCSEFMVKSIISQLYVWHGYVHTPIYLDVYVFFRRVAGHVYQIGL